MKKEKEGVYCHYQYFANFVTLFVTFPFLCFMIYSVVKLSDFRIFALAIIMTIGFVYYLLELINKSVTIKDGIIIDRSFWGQNRRWKVNEITEIIFKNGGYREYVIIKVGDYKFKMKMYAKGYSLLCETLASTLNLKNYDKKGKIRFVFKSQNQTKDNNLNQSKKQNNSKSRNVSTGKSENV